MANPEKSSADFIAAAHSVLASKDESARRQMFGVAMQAMAMLESPLDTVWRIIMSVSWKKTYYPSLKPSRAEYLIKLLATRSLCLDDSDQSRRHPRNRQIGVSFIGRSPCCGLGRR